MNNLVITQSVRFASQLILYALFVCTATTEAATATGQRAIAATGHPIATQAALDTFKRGGNAIDAAVAAGLMLGVVDGHNSGIGGSCVMTIRLANGRVVCVDGLSRAPLSATRGTFLRHGRADPGSSQIGPKSVGVPGALAAYEYALAQFGRMSLHDVILPAARVAEEGFKLDSTYGQKLLLAANDLKDDPAARRVFFDANGQLKRIGDVLQQPELARTYRTIATEGTRWFYSGQFGLKVGDWLNNQGGAIGVADFPAYQARQRDPIATAYRGYTIVGFPPPGSGGVVVGEVLNILENFNLRAFGTNSPTLVHIVTEAMKLASADRAQWIGDPDQSRVPRGLLSKPYAAQLARRISTNRVMAVPSAGVPPNAATDIFRHQTTHFSTADAQGNWVSCTASLNTSFGAKLMVPETGVLLNNDMDNFSVLPGVPNFFGLTGSDANSVAMLKRPTTSMAPTIVLRNNRPVMALGAAGGPTIASQVLLTIINVVDFGMSVETALQQPRFHHQGNPDELKIENSANADTIAELTRRGHHVTPVDSLGVLHLVGLQPNGKEFVGVTDPRSEGAASGF